MLTSLSRCLLHKKRNIYLFGTGSVISYIASFEMMDHSLFLLPISLLALIHQLKVRNINRKHFFILGTLILSSFIYKYWSLKINPTVSAAKPIAFSLSTTLHRTRSFFYHTSPFGHDIFGSQFKNYKIIFLCQLILTSIVFFRSSNRVRYHFLLATTWAISSSIVFLTISKYFSSRYSHIAGFGVCFVSVLLIERLIEIIFRTKKIKNSIKIFVLSLIIISVGTSRVTRNSQYFSRKNIINTLIKTRLNQIELSNPTQIAIINGSVAGTNGWFLYSSGYLKMLTNNRHVKGIAGPEKFDYNAFNPSNTCFTEKCRMSGLNLNSPIYLYRYECESSKCDLNQLSYAAQKADQRFNLIHLDKNKGKSTIIKKFNSKPEFLNYISQNKINIKDVAFIKG